MDKWMYEFSLTFPRKFSKTGFPKIVQNRPKYSETCPTAISQNKKKVFLRKVYGDLENFAKKISRKILLVFEIHIIKKLGISRNYCTIRYHQNIHFGHNSYHLEPLIRAILKNFNFFLCHKNVLNWNVHFLSILEKSLFNGENGRPPSLSYMT